MRMFENSANYCKKKKSFENASEKHQDISQKEKKAKAAIWLRMIFKSSRGRKTKPSWV